MKNILLFDEDQYGDFLKRFNFNDPMEEFMEK